MVILAKSYPSATSDALKTLLVGAPLRSSYNIRITPCWLVGCLAMILGALMRLACYRTLGPLFTFRLSVKKGHTLITTGLYSVVRHPGYAALLLVSPGVIVSHFGPGSWYSECIGWGTWGSWAYTTVCAAWMASLPLVAIARVPIEDEVLMCTEM